METQPAVLMEHSLFNYFRPFVREAMDRQAPKAAEETEFYLVKLLSEFGRSGRLFNGVGRKDPALAVQLVSAIGSSRPSERVGLLKRVGDYTLYMAGFFSAGLNTRLVDLDYYTSLGTTAYHQLAYQRLPGDVNLTKLFNELALGFDRFVDVLRWVADRSKPPSDQEILQMYSAWLHTGCRTSAQRLERLGYTLPERGPLD